MKEWRGACAISHQGCIGKRGGAYVFLECCIKIASVCGWKKGAAGWGGSSGERDKSVLVMLQATAVQVAQHD